MLKHITNLARMTRIRLQRKYRCCRLPWNLTQEASERADLYVERCVCGRRHRIMRADPGTIGVAGTPTGGHVRPPDRIAVWLLAIVVASATPALAQGAPWIVYGQTAPVCQGGINNPKPNVNGLVGEVSALPYTVPTGKTLVITGYGLEAYANVPYGLVLAPYLGPTPPASNAAFLHSVYADNASNETVGVEFHLPAGTIFNLRLMSSECPAQVVGWYVKGRLVDAP